MLPVEVRASRLSVGQQVTLKTKLAVGGGGGGAVTVTVTQSNVASEAAMTVAG